MPNLSAVPTTPDAPLLIDEVDLTARLGQATPKDTCKGMFFNGVLQATEQLVGDDARADALSKSGEKKFVDFFNYSIARFLPMAYCSAEHLMKAEGGWEGAFRRLGRQATDDFLATAVGKTLLLLAGSDPRRLINSLPSGYKTAVSYGQRAVVWTGPTTCVLSMRRDFMPHPYHEGVLLQVIETIGVKRVSVQGKRVTLLDADYTVNWDPKE